MKKLCEIIHSEKRNKKGFTIMELLFVVAVLVVLFGLVALSVVRMQKELRQKELDSKAEIIYVAAQNRITELKAQGMKTKYEAGGTELGFIPYDADKTVMAEETEFYYTSSVSKADETKPAYWVLPEGTVDSELYSGNWIIEYNIKSGSIYSVFYSESPITKSVKELDYLRSKDARMTDGARIGYYGGEIAIIQTTRELIIEKLNIINEETLTAEMTVFNPVSDDFRLTYWLEDAAGNKTAEKEITEKTFIGGGEYTAKLNLDSLANTASRFHSLFPELSAGTDFTLHVSARIPDNLLIKKGERSETANSLFANRSAEEPADTAQIRFGRHLQNLDKDSGVSEEITAAVQRNDIFFSENGERENEGKLWLDVYGNKRFTAIDNPNLLSYSGTYVDERTVTTIYGLNAAPNSSAEASAGLFAKAYNGMEISDLRLSGTTIASGKYSGALVGKTEGNVTINGCSVLLSSEKGDLNGKAKDEASQLESRLSGTDSVGGLVSYAQNGLTIEKSFAATIIRSGNTGFAGGLVGRAEGTLTVLESYADCYVSGNTAGGIAGSTGTLVMQDSYAAGYVTAETAAYGISGGAISSSSARSYTAVHTTNAKPFYSTASSGSALVYYLEEGNGENSDLSGTVRKSFGEMSDLAEFAALLGNKFTTVTGGNSNSPYNLLYQGLTDYSYPKLASIATHYGDWNAEFVSAQLVYFEEYANGSFGFSGANKDNLRAAGPATSVVGDGYALVFDSATKPSAGDTFTFSYQLSDDGTMSAEFEIDSENSDYRTVEDGGETYYLLPVRSGNTDPVNAGYSVEDPESPSAFYRRIVIKNGGNSDTYYFNPHFAKTVTSDLPTRAPVYVYIRSPRQLYLMSLEYQSYVDFIDSGSVAATFKQETALYYENYKWDDYFPTDEANFRGGQLLSQSPIGDGSSPFVSIYDGSCCGISGVSFVSGGNYVGMFGASTGRLMNVVLTQHDITDGSQTQVIRRSGTIMHNGTNVYMGVLCGQNRGTIYNCAVANYKAVVDVNQGASLALGGLCGINEGTITNSSAVISSFEVSSLYSEIYAGGFAGINDGAIRYCYALSSIETKSANSTRPVKIAGFTAENSGDINYCYCAGALSTSGSATSSGFSPADSGSTAKNSFYINNGTYYYTDDLFAYKSEEDYGAVGPQEVNATELKNENISRYFGKTIRSNSYDRYGKFYKGETNYPFPAIVRDAFGNYIHYGDWIIEANLGENGVFYWEYEEGSGSNSGYHLSFIGIEGDSVVSDSTLCNAHDDGGSVTSYGYGFYYRGNSAPTLEIDDSINLNENSTRYRRNSEAEAALHTILSEFSFVAYTTGTPNGANSNPNGVLYIEGNSANSKWELTPAGANAVTHVFDVCPFFADSMNYVSSGGVVLDADTRAHSDNYQSVPGGESNPYQVRSVEQLQYINWNNSTKSVSENVTPSNYQRFSYLQYTNITNSGSQLYSTATRLRPVQYWDQTHDLDGDNGYFYPIAGTFVTTGERTYNAVLYTWFGGSYNGESYVIRNLQIDSKVTNVGVFGTTVAAKMENIILYSDMDSVIQRNTEAGDFASSYVVGGLIGIAYDYVNDSTIRGQNEITNCAIAGYKIIDNSKNQQTLGEANVGGLVGVTGVNLNKCSAVVDIEINCTHRTANGGYTSAQYGNFIRVGGIAGACRYNMQDCYSGGSIKVGEETLRENIARSGANVLSVTTEQFRKEDSTHVFIGGLGGSGFCSNFTNFNGNSFTYDGTPEYSNCYTYMAFPKLEGTVRAISLMGSVADRYNQGARAKIRNCYYLDSCANIEIDETSHLRGAGNANNALPQQFASNPIRKTDMLIGRLGCVGLNLVNSNTNNSVSELNGLTPLTYEQMSERLNLAVGFQKANSTDTATYTNFADALGASFSWVTIEENGASVNGKYSFAGSDLALEGKNYPFPTVITQKSLIDQSTVNVHYGAWTKFGLFWSESMNYIDIFRDYNYDLEEATKEMVLSFESISEDGADASDFTFEYFADNGNYLEGNPDAITPTDSPVVAEITNGSEAGSFNVTLEAQNTGACYVRATYSKNGATYTADCYVSVSAEFAVTADPSFASIYIGDEETADLTVLVQNSDGTETNLVEKDMVAWEIINSKPESHIIFYDTATQPVKGDDKYTFNFEGVGEGDLQLSFTAKVNLTLGEIQREFTKTAFLSVSVKKLGRIGISSVATGTDIRYNEATLPKGEISGETYLSTNTDYSAAANKPTVAEEPIFLYGNGTGIDIDEFGITKIEILKDGAVVSTVKNGDATDYSKYYVFVEAEKIPDDGDSNFDYRLIRINGTESGAIEIRMTLEHFGNTYIVTAPYYLTAAEPKAILTDESGNVLLEKTAVYGSVPALTAADWDRVDSAANLAGIDLGYHADRAAGTTPVLAAAYVDEKYTVKLLPNTYTVQFRATDTDVTGSMAEIPATYDVRFALPELAFERLGYKFSGWRNSATGETFADKQSVSNLTSENNAAVELNPLWTEVPDYGIAYDLNGGTGTAPAAVPAVKHGQTVTLAQGTGITRTGHNFLGWARSQTATESIGTTVKNLTEAGGTLTLYAVWEKASYNVTFALNGGTMESNPSGLKEYDSAVTLPVPTREGHDFLGWSDGTNTHNGSFTVPAKDVTLTARWNIKSYTVTFDSNGGTYSGEPAVMQNYQTAVTLPTAQKAGAIFAGWSDGTSTYTGSFTVPAKDVTLKAVWKHTVTFNTNGGTVSNPPTEQFEGEEITLPAATRVLNKFMGWSDGTNTYAAGSKYTVNTNVTFAATWRTAAVYLPDGTNATEIKERDNGAEYRVSFEQLSSSNFTVHLGSASGKQVQVTNLRRSRFDISSADFTDDLYIVMN